MEYTLKILLSFFFYFLFFISQSQTSGKSNLRITCYIKGSAGKKILLGNKPKGAMFPAYKIEYYDSCYSINDSFKFNSFLKEPTVYSIEIENKKGWLSFLPTPNENIKIIGSVDSLYKSKISGSKEDSLFENLVGALRPIEMKLGTGPRDSFKFYLDKINEEKYNFVVQNPSSFLAALDIEGDSFNKLDSVQKYYLKKSYLALSPKAKNFEISKTAYYNLFVAPEKLKPNNMIPNFDFINYDKSTFNLYDYMHATKQKYYLIDFWATWCKPCIAQLPALKEIYEKYLNKGFDIISYSLDVDKNKFEDYINTKPMAWKSVTDLKGDESTVSKLFTIGSIPANFLIDENGIIIAVDIKPNKLSEILKDKSL